MENDPQPNEILSRYDTLPAPQLNEEELTIVRQHLAETCLTAVFGVLPLQAANSRFSDTGFVAQELAHARARIETDGQRLIRGPYVAGDIYYPAGVMLYQASIIENE